ncbi:DUF3574 domain-containing protein [uncultured Methylobacterium sp.]|uniref:DUF3574 domain-containing protein n=1 Tax=uncultured Methylobacterium sp. TaxID=157278 RepID=UPI0025925578|nr:DUF3574 domain-containing protein [uncultured Methylobacterium sp.]
MFGLSRRDGRPIPEAAWRRFLAARITPLFPNGLTVIAGHGQWRSAGGRLRAEPTRLVLIVAEDRPETRAALDAIRDAYKAAFAQEAVGLVLSPACASFR